MLAIYLLLSCHGPATKLDDTASPGGSVGDGLFLHGCPVASQARARVLQDVAEQPWGPDALAAPGDVLLLNERAAFVIQSPDDPRTYYHYGGIPVDAVAVDGCEQAGPEALGELGFVLGQLDLGSFNDSSMHMVRGDSMDIVNDGSDGGAVVVEVHGSDDRFWLVEETLIRGVYQDGGRKTLDALYGLDITVRYTLPPNDATLQIDVLLDGQPVTDGFLVGALSFPSDDTPAHAWSSGNVSVGGFGLVTGVPFVEAGLDQGSTAIAMPGGNMARVVIAGVTALIDSNQALVPLQVLQGQTDTPLLLSVGPTDPASASAALEPWLPEPSPGLDTAWSDVSGTVTDPSGTPVAGVRVDVSTPDALGSWQPMSQLYTDEAGHFSGRSLAVAGQWRLRAAEEGRDAGEELAVDPNAATDLALSIGAHGEVQVAATDGQGTALPVRAELERDDGLVIVSFPTPQDPSIEAPPGHYTAFLTRGYEYEPATVELSVPEDGSASLSATLPHVVDTTGWVSFDSHVHAGPSADSTELPVQRMRTAAGSGLDLVISTDHEVIVDLSGAVEEAGLSDILAYALGSEVTAIVPEHTNAWPFPVHDDVRGDPVRWYQLGFPGIFAAERKRGAQVIQLNHSRVDGECGILCVLDWDRMSEAPSTDDPEALALPPGTEIWSWDFDSFEVMNSLRSPYLWPDDPRHSGALYDWMAFHNLGHKVTGVAVTDIHSEETPGTPRTYAQVADDAPGAFTVDEVAQAVLDGAAVIGVGAFARVTLDGAGPGQTVTDTDGTVSLWLHIEGIPEIDLTRVDVLVDCDPALSLSATDAGGVVKLDQTLPLVLPLNQDAYVIVIAMGEQPMPRGLESADAATVPRAITNPIFVDGDGDGVWTAPGPKDCGWTAP